VLLPLSLTASQTAPAVPRFDHVDALRGVAVLLVVMAHTPVPPKAAVLNEIGAYGVQLFFIVSAFTLFLSMASRTARDTSPVLFFFIRRFFRIAPAFYLAAAFYLMKDGLRPGPWAPDGIHAWQIIATLLFAHGWHPFAFNAVVPGGWSIAAEMTFYLFVPLCFSWITNMYRAFALSTGLAFLAVIANHFALREFLGAYAQYPTLTYWFPRLWFPAQACVFPIGFALYFLCNRKTGSMLTGRKIWISIFSGALATVILWRLHLAQPFLPVAFAIGTLVYVVMLTMPRLVVNPIVQYIGKISFSVYLFHFWSVALIEHHLAPIWRNANPILGAACFYVSAVTFSCLVASLAHKFIEDPGQAIGRVIINRIKAKGRNRPKGNP
jgi:peptidoglycan/LPS O-acetylase OafA/YrhL